MGECTCHRFPCALTGTQMRDARETSHNWLAAPVAAQSSGDRWHGWDEVREPGYGGSPAMRCMLAGVMASRSSWGAAAMVSMTVLRSAVRRVELGGEVGRDGGEGGGGSGGWGRAGGTGGAVLACWRGPDPSARGCGGWRRRSGVRPGFGPGRHRSAEGGGLRAWHRRVRRRMGTWRALRCGKKKRPSIYRGDASRLQT